MKYYLQPTPSLYQKHLAEGILKNSYSEKIWEVLRKTSVTASRLATNAIYKLYSPLCLTHSFPALVFSTRGYLTLSLRL